jgi:integrase
VRELAGKSENAVRSFTFSPELTKKIRRYIAAMPEGQRWLFCTRNGKPWHYTWVRRRLLATCDRLGIEGAQTKAFRHGSASYMFSQNVPGPVITSRLGHHSADFTEKVYAKALMQDEIALALRMDKPVIQ